jgi:PmbA protein
VSEPIRPLVELLRGTARADGGPFAAPRDWRLSTTSWESAFVGVRDGIRAGVHAPVTLVHGFALDYLFQWEDGLVSAGGADRLAIADPRRFLALARQAAYDDRDSANFAAPTGVPRIALHSERAAEEARSGGTTSFAALLDVAARTAAARGFATWSGTTSARTGWRRVLTSRGFEAASETTHVAYSFWYEGKTGDGHTSRDVIGGDEAARRIDRAADYVTRLASADAGFTPGEMPVLLHPRVVESLVSFYILANLHGGRIYHGQSAYRATQFAARERVMGPSIGLHLEPLVPMDPGSFSFTDEGVPARALAYVEDGRLTTPIVDMKYARRLGMPPSPGPASSDSLRLSGRGGRDEAAAIGSVSRGVLVLSLLGLHTQDSTRGDFSVSAPLTLAIADGELRGAVKAVLAGNFFDVLRDPRLELIAFEGFRMPGLLCTGSVGLAPS